MNHRINITEGDPSTKEVRVSLGNSSFWCDGTRVILTREHVRRRLDGVIRRLARKFDCTQPYDLEQDALLRAKAVYEDLLE